MERQRSIVTQMTNGRIGWITGVVLTIIVGLAGAWASFVERDLGEARLAIAESRLTALDYSARLVRLETELPELRRRLDEANRKLDLLLEWRQERRRP